MKRSLCFLLALVLALGLCACGGTAAPAPAAEEPAGGTETDAVGESGALRHAEITIRDYGTVLLELDASSAPLTVANFCKLAQEGFYDGLTFHRIMDGFMI